jgi:hypothetical protein
MPFWENIMNRNTAPLLPMLLVTFMTSLSAFSQDSAPAGSVSEVIKAILSSQKIYYVSLNGLRVRATPEDTGKTLGLLSLNEKVKIINPETIYNNKYVEIEIVRTVNKITLAEKYFVAFEYLSEKFIDYRDFKGKYFAVVNVATETLRLYERACMEKHCGNKMILETEVVVGEDVDMKKEEKGKGRSILGSYRVQGWSKFYQDVEGHYPSWYKDGYPEVPKINAGWSEWFKEKYMPTLPDGKTAGHMRGAFGWYTAFAGPSSYNQWTHGTIGWGVDKDKYIKKTKQLITNIFANPRSSGCTRNNNEAIAYIRQFIEIGAPLIKIYAKEALLDPTEASYPAQSLQWNYVLTKKAAEKADRADVLKTLKVNDIDLDAYWQAKKDGGELILDPSSPLNQVLEVGTYDVDVHPDVIEYTPGEKLTKLERAVGRKGNVYGVKSKDMSEGIYYVDAGMLESYQHPKAILETGGFSDEVIPPWMDFMNLNQEN